MTGDSSSRESRLAAASSHLQRTLDLLEFERDVDMAQTSLLASKCSPRLLEQRGLAVLGLSVSSVTIGLGGKTLVELQQWMKGPFPAHGFRNGDTAEILPSSAGPASKEGNSKGSSSKKGKGKDSLDGKDADASSVQGVVYRVHEDKIVIALDSSSGKDDKEPELPEKCRIQKLANTVTYDRMEKTLKRVLKAITAPSPPDLHEILLNLREPTFTPLSAAQRSQIKFLDENLNDSQKSAVLFAVYEADQLALLHGPPGTGKTSTLIECIRHLVALNKRVLVCSASNLAVDNILERLAPHLQPGEMSRLGHPARILPQLMRNTLDYQTTFSNSGQVTKELKEEIEGLTKKLTSGKVRGKERREGWQEIRELRKEYRKREGAVVKGVVSQAKVVLATCHGAGSRQIQDLEFDALVIDEAAQALEAVCWIPLLKTKTKVILAGDHLQLPPTIKSSNEPLPDKLKLKDGKKGTSPKSLEVTLFDRLLDIYGQRIKRLLDVQYRMNEKIMQFPSSALYSNKLTAHSSVATRLLADLPDLDGELGSRPPKRDDDDGLLTEPVIFFDTAGAMMYERVEEGDEASSNGKKGTVDGESKRNENEAELVMKFIDELATAGIPQSSISVITPYNAQVSLILSLLRDKYPVPLVGGSGEASDRAISSIECGSVDGFQGREKDVIILSLVRSNDKKEVGFLAEKRRLNVAMTRAKRCLCVIGDSETIREGGGKFLKDWMEWLEENADVRIVQ